MIRFCLIDVSNLVHRMKHAIKKKGQHSSQYYDPFGDDSDYQDQRFIDVMDAVLTNIVNVNNQFEADHCVVAFDRRSWRKDFYPEYKANRHDEVKTPEEELDHQLSNEVIDNIQEFFSEYTNLTVLECEGCEADDLIARWVQVHNEPIFHNVIVSGDSDFKQLVSENVELYNPLGSARILYTTHGVYQQTGKRIKRDEQVELYGRSWSMKKTKTGENEKFDPSWLLFEKCIRGDSTDNVKSAWPGVRTTKMQKAFYGSVEDYNNFINSTWGKDDVTHSVKQLYDRNRTLIDLSAQPESIVESLDECICEALEKTPARLIGAHFARFCSAYNLNGLKAQAEKISDMLSKGYPS